MTECAPHHPTAEAVETDRPNDDVALLAAVARGDTRALRHLYEAYADWIWGIARLRMARNHRVDCVG